MVEVINYPELDFIRNIFEEYGEKFKFSIGQIISTEKYYKKHDLKNNIFSSILGLTQY